jgi:hypothetical protein
MLASEGWLTGSLVYIHVKGIPDPKDEKTWPEIDDGYTRLRMMRKLTKENPDMAGLYPSELGFGEGQVCE